mmetsp:Transcript_4616/g.10710  ORF Transcript_4616/g.10710 Transcript_4616/m.10710 type:complete len:212 (+) Transcript_4616:187-822(+)
MYVCISPCHVCTVSTYVWGGDCTFALPTLTDCMFERTVRCVGQNLWLHELPAALLSLSLSLTLSRLRHGTHTQKNLPLPMSHHHHSSSRHATPPDQKQLAAHRRTSSQSFTRVSQPPASQTSVWRSVGHMTLAALSNTSDVMPLHRGQSSFLPALSSTSAASSSAGGMISGGGLLSALWCLLAMTRGIEGSVLSMTGLLMGLLTHRGRQAT